MANRRLISKGIHQDNKFLKLSIEARYLYDELVLYADDDGFCSQIIMINALNHFTDESYQELENAGFIIVYDGVALIVDWLNNQDLKNHTETQQIELAQKTYIRTDWRYTNNSNDENIAMKLNDFNHKYNRRKKEVDLESLKETRNQMKKAEKAFFSSETAPNINKEKQSLPPKFPTVNQIEIEQLIKFINSKFKATFSNSDEELAFFLSNELKKSSVEQIKDNLMAIKDKLEFTPENNNLCLSVIKNEYPHIMRDLEENDIDDDFPI